MNDVKAPSPVEKKYNIYCDESCHLEHDDSPVMCIGYTKIEHSLYPKIKCDIKAIKLKHKSPTELKWNKLSMSRLELYKEVIDYFFNNDIEFRCVLIKNKQNLDHAKYNKGDHNTFYDKTVYLLLNSATNPIDFNYKVHLDVRETHGKERLNTIEEIFSNKHRGESPFKNFQHIHSDENELLQLTDLFIGAITYKCRPDFKADNASKVKKLVISYLESKSGYLLDEGTEPWETKFNIFDFQPKSSSNA